MLFSASGTVCLALSLAEMASICPISGAQYHVRSPTACGAVSGETTCRVTPGPTSTRPLPGKPSPHLQMLIYFLSVDRPVLPTEDPDLYDVDAR
jgi:hypothetical protein